MFHIVNNALTYRESIKNMHYENVSAVLVKVDRYLHKIMQIYETRCKLPFSICCKSQIAFV